VGLDGADVSLTHVAAGGLNSGFLVVTECFVEEPADGLAALARAKPDHAGTVQVIDQRGVLMPLEIGDFINADGLEAAAAMALAQPANGAMH
jgi:hypothetical protein